MPICESSSYRAVIVHNLLFVWWGIQFQLVYFLHFNFSKKISVKLKKNLMTEKLSYKFTNTADLLLLLS